MAQALAANRVVELPRITSIARTLGAPAVCETTLLMAQRYLESVTVVSDAEAVAALHLLMERAKIVTEPAASCTLAAAERMKDNFSPADHVVLILCGGNLSLNDLYESEFRFRSLNGGFCTKSKTPTVQYRERSDRMVHSTKQS